MLDRLPVLHFQDDESLYRRYLPSHFQDGELDPGAIRFDEPPSFLRSAFSIPEDALHKDCAEGQNVSHYGVLGVRVSLVQCQERVTDGRAFEFSAIHRPLSLCYAHSEIQCICLADPVSMHTEPPKSVKRAFRLRLAKALSVEIPAP